MVYKEPLRFFFKDKSKYINFFLNFTICSNILNVFTLWALFHLQHNSVEVETQILQSSQLMVYDVVWWTHIQEWYTASPSVSCSRKYYRISSTQFCKPDAALHPLNYHLYTEIYHHVLGFSVFSCLFLIDYIFLKTYFLGILIFSFKLYKDYCILPS